MCYLFCVISGYVMDVRDYADNSPESKFCVSYINVLIRFNCTYVHLAKFMYICVFS